MTAILILLIIFIIFGLIMASAIISGSGEKQQEEDYRGLEEKDYVELEKMLEDDEEIVSEAEKKSASSEQIKRVLNSSYRLDEKKEEQRLENINKARLSKRRIDEIIGVCRGIIADNKINKQEAEFLLRLIKSSGVMGKWPFNVLLIRLEEALGDSILTNKKEEDLLDLLESITGGETYKRSGYSNSTTLPLDDPPPSEIIFKDRTFCCTGKFLLGPRKKVEEIINLKGGIFCSGMNHRVNYLVIGGMGNPAWLHSSYGTKIEEAIEIRKNKKILKNNFRISLFSIFIIIILG